MLPGEEGIILQTVNDIADLGSQTSLTADTIVLDTVNTIDNLGGIIAASSNGEGITAAVTDPLQLQNLATQASRVYGNLFAEWDAKALTGYSLRADVDGIPSQGDAMRNGQVVVETLLRDRIVYIEISNDLDPAAHGPVTEYNVNLADGRPLPFWVRHAENGLLFAEPPVGVKELQFEIAPILQDGTVLNHSVAVELASGEVRALDKPAYSGSLPFSEQLKSASEGAVRDLQDMGKGVEPETAE